MNAALKLLKSQLLTRREDIAKLDRDISKWTRELGALQAARETRLAYMREFEAAIEKLS